MEARATRMFTRSLRMAPVCVAALWAAGCCLGVRAPGVPAEFFTTEPGMKLAAAEHPETLYPSALPSLTDMQAEGSLTVGRRFWPGKQRFGYRILAQPQARRLRMIGTNGPTKVFTLVADDKNIALVLGKDGFEGAIPPEGSELRGLIGIEPHELLNVLSLPLRVTRGEFEAAERCRRWRLTPAEKQADGLAWIELDQATGLPAAACWKRGEDHWWRAADSWRADVTRWEKFKDPQGAVKSALLPAEVAVSRNRGGIRMKLTLDACHFYPADPAAFERPGGRGIYWMPLAELVAD